MTKEQKILALENRKARLSANQNDNYNIVAKLSRKINKLKEGV